MCIVCTQCTFWTANGMLQYLKMNIWNLCITVFLGMKERNRRKEEITGDCAAEKEREKEEKRFNKVWTKEERLNE